MADTAEQPDDSKVKTKLSALRQENKRLREENAQLRRQNEGVAAANARAAELVVKLEQVNKELESSTETANLMSREAVAANRAKSDFLANMSHEIRTPMNAILGFCEVLAEEDLTDEQKYYVEIIRGSSKSLIAIINDILDFSKIEAGKLDTEIIACSMGQILGAIESLMRPAAVEKGLSFEVIQKSKLPVGIRTDPVRLRQCLINLVSNAIKFTEKGHVYLKVSLQQLEDKSYIRFDIEDTGIGVVAEKQELIFGVFSQADNGTTRRFGGTGLGLAITKRLVHLLGGEITLSSESGKGTVFSLIIPAGIDVKSQPLIEEYRIADEPCQEQQPCKTWVQNKFSGRVLVAEDSETNQKLLDVLLQRLGLEVAIAQDGKGAVDKALSEPFDLIFMDIQMPNMNGYAATKAIRKKGLKMPIVALTANAMEGDDKKCISAGCNDYLAKPVERKKLLQIIRKYLPSGSTSLSNRIDSVKSQVEQLSRFCSDPDFVGIESGENIIDWQELAEQIGDAEAIKEIMAVFLIDSANRIESLISAVNAADPEDAKLHSHTLKGAAATIAARPLSQVAYKIELATRENDIDTAKSLLACLQAEFDKLKSFVSKPDWVEIAKQQSKRITYSDLGRWSGDS